MVNHKLLINTGRNSPAYPLGGFGVEGSASWTYEFDAALDILTAYGWEIVAVKLGEHSHSHQALLKKDDEK